MTDAIKKYWLELEERERMILGGGGIVVALILFYVLIWQPWHKSIDSMKESIQPLRSDLVWVRQHAEIIKNGGPAVDNKSGKDKSLLSLVESSAKRNKVDKAIQQMVPTNDDQVRVVLDKADFNNWVKWVDELSVRYGINVVQAKADRDDDKPNTAEVRMTFVR